MKKWYTVIWSDSRLIGSHMNSIVKYKYVYAKKIGEWLERYGYDGPCWFVFKGKCKIARQQ